MKIITVTYAKLVSDPKAYGNQTIGVEVIVEHGETAEEVLDRARKWVERELALMTPKVEEAKQTLLQTRLDAANKTLTKINELLGNEGEEVPF